MIHTSPLLLKENAAYQPEVVFSPIYDSDLIHLQTLLNKYHSEDPYQRSATYYAMTGRRGIWWVRDNDSAVIFCRHPNNNHEILVFPSIGLNGENIMKRTLQSLDGMKEKVKLARFYNPLPDFQFETRTANENILDWKYPVRTINVKSVSSLKGGEFQEVRQKLNRLDYNKTFAHSLDIKLHKKVIKQIVQQWGGKDIDKSSPYNKLLELFDHVPMAGRIIYHDNLPAGFSIWEETNAGRGIANAFAHIGLHDVKGLSQFVIVDMCRTLNERNFKHVCIGGSETEGLDRFKRKFFPIKTTPLSSHYIV